MQLFILAANNMHSFPFLRYLVDKCEVRKDKIRVLFFDIESETDLPDNINGIEFYYSQDWNNPKLYTDINSVTISSLSSFTNQAEYIHKIFSLGLVEYYQLIIRITDDEVDRWNKVYNDNGKLVISKEAYVDEFTLAILQKVSRFICLYRPWGNNLEKLLGRELTIYDVSILVNPFINSDVYNLYADTLRPSIRKQVENSQTIRVLMHTKPIAHNLIRNMLYKDLLNFILKDSGLLESRTLEVSLWWPSIRDMPALNLVIALLISLSKIKKIKLRFNFINNMPIEVYYSFLASVHILVAQDRGGLGAIFEASKNGSIVVIDKGSYNAEVYLGYRSIPFIESAKSENVFTSAIKLLKENNFDTLLNEQQPIATQCFEEQFFKSKNTLLKVYS